MKYLLLVATTAALAWAHCPEYPQLPECPPVVQPPQPPVGSGPTADPLPTLYVFIKEVFLEAVAGSATVQSSPISVAFVGIESNWQTQVRTDSGGNWLGVSPDRGSGDGLIRLQANTAGLKAGSYTGTVTVIAPFTINFSSTIRVTLRVRDPIRSTLRITPSTLNFTAREGTSAAIAAQRVAISMEGETSPSWSVTGATSSGGNWLSVSPATGTGNGEFIVRATLGDLPAGVYAGRLNIAAPDASNPATQIPVFFTVERPASVIPPNGIMNAASMRSGPIAPGQIVSIMGERLGPRAPLSNRVNEATGRYATALGGTRISFDGVPGIPLYVATNQINALVPFEIAGRRTVKVTVEAAGYEPAELPAVPVAATAPGLFSSDGVRAIVLNQDSSVNSPSVPAAPGDVIQLFATGQGMTNPRVETGTLSPATAPFAAPEAQVSLFIGGQPAEIVFAGLAPGSAGLLQINARIPEGVTPSENVPIMLAIGDAQSAGPRVIAVKAAQ